jgi:HEAT repeat protein
MDAQLDFDALLAQLRSPESQKRLEAIKTLGELRDQRAVDPLGNVLSTLLCNDSEFDYAAEALGTIGGPRALELLLKRLKRGSPDSSVIRALGHFKDDAAVEALLPLVDPAEPGARDWAAGALAEIGGPAVPGLMRKLESPSRTVRMLAAQALCRIGAPQASDALKELLQLLVHPSWRIRQAMAAEFGHWRPANRDVLDGLSARLKDPVPQVKTAAAWALESVLLETLVWTEGTPAQDAELPKGRDTRTGSPESGDSDGSPWPAQAKERLRTFWWNHHGVGDWPWDGSSEKRTFSSEDQQVEDSERCVSNLGVTLKETGERLVDCDRKYAREDMLRILVPLGEPKLLDALLFVLREPFDLTHTAESLLVDGFTRIGGAVVVDALIGHLAKLPNNNIGRSSQAWAAKALGRIRSPRAVDALLRSLGDSDPEQRGEWQESLRVAAAGALQQIGDGGTAVVDLLLQILRDPAESSRLRSVAATALGTIATKVCERLTDRSRYPSRQSKGEAADICARASPLLQVLCNPQEAVSLRTAAASALGEVAVLASKVRRKQGRNDWDKHRGGKSGACPDSVGDSCENWVETLRQILRDPAEGSALRSAAATALGALEDAAAVDILWSLATDRKIDHDLWKSAMCAVAKIEGTQAIRRLGGKPMGEDLQGRMLLAMSLGEKGGDEVMVILCGFLSDQHPSVRETALLALSKIGNSTAKTAMYGLFDDPDRRIAQTARHEIQFLPRHSGSDSKGHPWCPLPD